MYAEIVFPLPFRNSFTYSVPAEFRHIAQAGVRAVSPFGKRVLTGFIINLLDELPPGIKKNQVKPVADILDSEPIFTAEAIEFYRWLSDYYLSSLGEALKLGVPYGSDVESKRKISIDPKFSASLLEKEKDKSSVRAAILKVLSGRDEISLQHLQKLVRKKNIHSLLRTLEKQGAVTLTNEIEDPKVKVRTVKYVKLAKSLAEVYSFIPSIESRSPKQVKVLLDIISRKNKTVKLKDLLEKSEVPRSSIDSLEEKGIITVYDKEFDRRYVEHYEESAGDFNLTSTQQNAITCIEESIVNGIFKTYLIHGVTGSGKTQVYIELVRKVLANGKTALILVPEISLTPQITSRLVNNFGDDVSVLHSRMSLGERYDSWRRILNNKSRVVIGARSALFAPLKNIGIIIVDEEHDQSYKQGDITPRYHARDAAIFLGNLNKCPVILGSATPSVESMYNALNGKYMLLEMPDRIDNATLPQVKLVNIAIERKTKKMETVFSKLLLDKIEDRLRKKQGVIILQNRRGFSTQIYCEDCNEIETCDNCSVPMVYHVNKNFLQCHYCGFEKKVPHACTYCGSLNIKYFGTGTERVEDEIEFYFPNAKIKRIDSDTISRKTSLSKILFEFSKGEIDILVGTQMVSKGLDFSHVTLVGVISAETSLWLPDFRADERTFQLLIQVSGRAGRSSVAGEVIIQTHNERNFTLQKVVSHDYKGFYEKEIKDRERMGYPPFSRICLVETKDPDEEKAHGAMKDFYTEMQAYKKYLEISAPATALIARLKGSYRFHLMIKSSKDKDPGGKILRQAVINSFIEFNRKSRYRDVKLIYDVDPQSIM
jgi:primosomal protein N' (replication factor Y)